jgi:hypothetical protein
MDLTDRIHATQQELDRAGKDPTIDPYPIREQLVPFLPGCPFCGTAPVASIWGVWELGVLCGNSDCTLNRIWMPALEWATRKP